MSLALANASRMRPDIRLAQTASNFRATLSDEQKNILRRSEAQAADSLPDIGDVMRLTAEIDKFRKVGQRCFGPRLTSFLEAVQQFAAIGDVAIGGSQNIIACSVWALVRMSLLSIVNFASYLDRISTLLMSVGRSAPRFQVLATVYSKSPRMQSAISEYFIVVIQLCDHIIKFAQKSSTMQFASSIIDTDMKRIEADLEHWAKTIKDDAGMLSAIIVAKEAQENETFRALIRKNVASMSVQQKAKRSICMLDLCSKYDHQTAWKQIRKAGTCTLLGPSLEYQDWKHQKGPRTLIYTGKLGSGKSVLLANIVDDINLHIGSQKTFVGFFFCRHDIAESLQARTIYGCLARQWLQSFPDIEHKTFGSNITTNSWDIDDMRNVLLESLPQSSLAYFVLDGVDELGRSERQSLIQHLCILMKDFVNLRICLSYRTDAVTSTSPIFRDAAIVSMPDTNPDIEAFIDHELEKRYVSGELVLGDETLIVDIAEALTRGSSGMFLWVSLQIECLCTMQTDEQIRQALENLPKGLSQTYARILQKSSLEYGSMYQTQILELVIAAFRPLTTEELREALGVRPGDTKLIPERLPNNIHAALACCGPLITIDEEELSVRLVHQSVKQFLLTEYREGNFFTLERAHTSTLRTLLVYLSSVVFERNISATGTVETVLTVHDAASAPARILSSSLSSQSTVGNLAVRLLKSRKAPPNDFNYVLSEAKKKHETNGSRIFHLHSYARSYYSEHSLACPIIDDFSCSLLVKMIADQKRGYGLLVRLITTNKIDPTLGEVTEDDKPIFCAAARRGKVKLVNIILQASQGSCIDLEDVGGRTALTLAARFGHDKVVNVLLNYEDTPVSADKRDRLGRTALLAASEGSHVHVVKLLLESEKVDASARDLEGYTCFTIACKNNDRTLVEYLMESGMVDFTMADNSGNPSLVWAARYNHPSIFKFILQSGKVDPSKSDFNGWSPLAWACNNGSEEIVRLLLDHASVYPNHSVGTGETPLSLASEGGHLEVVRLLLQSVKMDLAYYEKPVIKSPLTLALRNRHFYVVLELLKTRNFDSDYMGTLKDSGISWAAEMGQSRVKEKVFEYGLRIAGPISHAAASGNLDLLKTIMSAFSHGGTVTDFKKVSNEQDPTGRTPLSWACKNGHTRIVEHLINTRKVDLNTVDYQGYTALAWAAYHGHTPVIRLLLQEEDVIVDSQDTEGRTPLSLAVEKGHHTAVEAIIQASPEVNLEDRKGISPLMWARRVRNPLVLQLFKKYRYI